MTGQLELIQQKKTLMNEIANKLSSWDQSTDEALQILTENNETIELMRTIDTQLTDERLISYNESHREVWKKIIQKQEELSQFVRSEKEKIGKQLVQMGNKEKVVSNYIGLQKKSAFIRKNY